MRAIFVKGLSQCTMSSRDIFSSLHCKLALPDSPIMRLSSWHFKIKPGTERVLCPVACKTVLADELFLVPEIKQEYFHNNRYPTITTVVYITAIFPIVCFCLTTSRRAVSDSLSQPPGMTRCTAFNACECATVDT